MVRDESTQSPLANPSDLTAVAFPQHVRTDKSWFEGQAAAGKTTYETFAYDQYGNITGYVDGADRGQSRRGPGHDRLLAGSGGLYHQGELDRGPWRRHPHAPAHGNLPAGHGQPA